MNKLFFIVFLFLSTFALSQKAITDLTEIENELASLAGQIKNGKSDSIKIAKSETLMHRLNAIYESYSNAFLYNFSKVKYVGFINSPDKQLRITNWNINLEDKSNIYYCLITRYDERLKKYLSTELSKADQASFSIPEGYLNEEEWYGALYYDIIPITKGGKTLYTLLGYRGGRGGSQIKLIDALSVSGRNKVKFGSPIFVDKKEVKKRVIFEYSKKSFMSLKFEPERGRIVFDHLSPETPSMAEFREFYIPDMSYDAYIYNNGRWDLKQDVVAINAPDDEKETYQVYRLNKDGVLESVTKKRKWVDPSDRNSPGTQNVHTSAMPEDNKTTLKAEKTKKKSKKEYKSSKTTQETLSPYQVIMKSKNRNKDTK